jgi:hypothetical protein
MELGRLASTTVWGKMRYFTCLLTVLLIGCSAKHPDRKLALMNLKSQADDLGRATVDEDYQKMADLTHPTLVDKFGGRDGFIQRLGSKVAEMKDQGFQFKQVTYSEPSKLVEELGELYAIVPFKAMVASPGGATATQPSFLIGVSPDGGITWKFINGSGVAEDRNKLKAILPNFPNELQLPDNHPREWKK